MTGFRTMTNRAAWLARALRRRPFECPPGCAEGHLYRWPCVGGFGLPGRLVALLSPVASRRVHNVLAHPLLELWPAAGEWLHRRTDPTGGLDDDAGPILPIIIRGPRPTDEEFAAAVARGGDAGALWIPEGVQVPEGRSCRGCGCTDDRACPGGCSWLEPGLCSSCGPDAVRPLEGPGASGFRDIAHAVAWLNFRTDPAARMATLRPPSSTVVLVDLIPVELVLTPTGWEPRQ